MAETAEFPQLQTVEKFAETPQTQMMQGTQTHESLGTTPVCQVAQTGYVEGIEIEMPLIQVVIDHEASMKVLMETETLKAETSGADGQMSSLFQKSLDVVSQTMKGLSGVCEEKHMSGILGTSGVGRTFRTQGHREHGQRDHVTEEQSKRRARIARQVWVKCGTKTKPLELNDETPEEIERKVRRLVNVNSSEKVYVLCQGKVVQRSKWMEMDEGCIFEVASHEGSGKQKKKKKEADKNPGVRLDETDSSNKEERESDGGQGKETENLELEHCTGGDGLAEKGGKESGWNENLGEKKFEEVDMGQIKEKMDDCMNIVVKNLVPLPKEDREKILLKYISMMPENVDEEDKKRAEIKVRWAVDKLAEEEAAEREWSITEAQR